MQRRKISILAIQSHCITQKGSEPGAYVIQDIGSFKFIYSPADDTGVGGVGFIVCNNTFKSISSITSLSNRVLRICITNKSFFKNVIYSVYSPTACSEVSIRDEFFNSLSYWIERESKGDMLIVLGDFNSVLPHFSVPSLAPNDNSNNFTDFLMSNQLIAVNTLFTKRPSQIYSFYGTKQRKTVLDYVLIRTKWARSCFDSNSCLIPTVSSDHNAIICKFKWTFAKKSDVPRTTQKDFTALNNEEVRLNVTNLIKSSVDSSYSSFVESAQIAFKTFLPSLPKTKKDLPWLDADIKSSRISLSHLRSEYLIDKTEDKKLKMNAKFLELSNLYSKKQTDFIDKACSNIEALNADHQNGAAWKLLNSLTGRKGKVEGLISADSSTDRLQKWEAHFRNLLSSSVLDLALSNNLPVLEPVFSAASPHPTFVTGPFSPEELKTALSAMKSKRAVGADQIPEKRRG